MLLSEQRHSASEDDSVTMFPSLKDPEHANVRIKNVGRQVYLCVTQDATGHPVLGTKTLNNIVDPEGECTLCCMCGVGRGFGQHFCAIYYYYLKINILFECNIAQRWT
jgi:hypothetical protein